MRRRDFVKTGALLAGASSLLRPQMWADVPDQSVGGLSVWLAPSCQSAQLGAIWHWPGASG